MYERIEQHDSQQVISLLFANGWQFVVSYLAIIELGHIAMPLDPTFKSLEMPAIIDQIKPTMVITDATYAGSLRGISKPVFLYEQAPENFKGSYEVLRYAADQQIASLIFTSGTTGKPKAVPNTHANHIWNIVACSEVWKWTSNDTLLVSVPLSHMLGIVMGLSGVIYHGNTMYLQAWFDEEETLKVLSSGKISFFSHAASTYVKLLAAPDSNRYDLSKVRLCVSGAAPLPPEVWHKFKDRFGIEILETYGTSETGRIAGNHLHERVLGSPGKPLPGVQLRLNEKSEVEVRSPGVFPGYYKNNEATKESMTDDGFWQTGDIAELRDGYIYLKGRVQERIRRFGYTISPRDIEWAMHKLADLKEIYVMGSPEPGKPDDRLVYFVVGNLDEKSINDFCKINLPYAWRPDKIELIDAIPRTRNGKAKVDELKLMIKD